MKRILRERHGANSARTIEITSGIEIIERQDPSHLTAFAVWSEGGTESALA
jgi:hypothetical protein